MHFSMRVLWKITQRSSQKRVCKVEITINKRDVKIAAIVLSVFGGMLAYGLHDTKVMKRELNALARVHIDEWFDFGPEPTDRSQFDYLAIVDSDKAFKFFGKGWGVIHFYVRDLGDTEMKSFKGVEFYYAREGGEWVLKDSAGCGAVEHHVRAFDEMLALGMDVPDRIFDKALGIDFDYKELMDSHEGHEHTSLPTPSSGTTLTGDAAGHRHDHSE